MTLLCDVNIIICWYKIRWRSRWTIFSDRNCPRRRLNFCVCVCVGVCLHNVERREEKRWRTHRGSRRHHATRRNPEGRGFVWTTTSHHLLTHSRQNRPRFLQETFLKEKKNKEKSCWRFNRFANEDEHSWLGNMYTYSINGRLMPRQQLIMQIPPQVPYVNFPPFFFLPFSNSGWTKSNYKRRYSKISDSRLTSSDTISIDWALFNVFRGSQSDLVRGGGDSINKSMASNWTIFLAHISSVVLAIVPWERKWWMNGPRDCIERPRRQQQHAD